MTYYMNEDSTSLSDIQKRLASTDLIPSHHPLLKEIEHNFGLLKQVGCRSVRILRTRLKSKKTIEMLAKESGVNSTYLTLLRRVLEGFFPKPQPLTAFNWLKLDLIHKLEKAGIKNTEQLYLAASSGPQALARIATGLEAAEFSELVALSDLSRVQWVSPIFARVLLAAGFDSAARVANAKPEILYQALINANAEAQYYQGKIGIRDIKRLVIAASYVPSTP